jgi:hypothetical protein
LGLLDEASCYLLGWVELFSDGRDGRNNSLAHIHTPPCTPHPCCIVAPAHSMVPTLCTALNPAEALGFERDSLYAIPCVWPYPVAHSLCCTHPVCRVCPVPQCIGIGGLALCQYSGNSAVPCSMPAVLSVSNGGIQLIGVWGSWLRWLRLSEQNFRQISGAPAEFKPPRSAEAG